MASNYASILTSFSYIEGMHMDKNDADIDTQIKIYIREKDIVQIKELIAHFAREGPKKRESKGDDKTNKNTNATNSGIVTEDSKENESKDTDFKESEGNKKSKRTIQRRIENMRGENGPITDATKEQLIRHGKMKADGTKIDGRGIYLTLRETIEMNSDLDKIINSRIKGNNIDKKMVLREINRCKNYILSSSQLDAFVLNLDNEDAELIEGFLRILHEYITKKEVKPQNNKILVEKLNGVLKLYQKGHEKYPMIRTYAIGLLGQCDKDAVIGQLIKDCEENRLPKFKNDYYSWNTAKAIKDAKIKLFDLENKLRRNEDTETADILADLRDWAEEIPETQKEMDELFKSGPCEIGEKPNMGGLKKYLDKQQSKNA